MSSELIVQLVIAVIGGGGLIGSGVALFKLRPDVNSAAVTDAQGAMKSMRELNDELKERLSELRAEKRASDLERDQALEEAAACRARLRRAELLLRHHDLI